jgi:hypothetical protein
MPKVTPTAQKPNLIAPDLLADETKPCRASLENAHKRRMLSRRNILNPQSTKRQNRDFLTRNKGPTAGVTGKCGNWRTEPPDAESAVWGRSPESVGESPHLSGARGVGRVLS